VHVRSSRFGVPLVFLVAFLVAFAVLATATTVAFDSARKPSNLRATAKTLTSASMDASTDDSGNFSYRVHLWGYPTVATLPKTQTSYTWTGLRPGVPYYFWVAPVAGSGNKPTSDLLVEVTVRDTTPPSPPGSLRVETDTASPPPRSRSAAPSRR
jgi:hypothetical protein